MNLSDINNMASGTGGCFEVSYVGDNIDAGNILSTDNYLEGAHTTVTLSKSSSCKIYTEANIYIHTNPTTTAPIDTTEAMRYKLITEDNVEYNGFVKKSCDSLLATIPITNTPKTYTIYIWIDFNLSGGFYHDTTYSGYIYAESSQTSTIENQDALPNTEKCQSSTKYVSFSYIGREQTYTIPKTGTYKLETWGAQGGSHNDTYYGGYGSYAQGNILLVKDQVLYINIGGQGISTDTYSATINGGYNGGGAGTGTIVYANKANTYESKGSGGGATHISTVTGILSTLENKKENVLIVSSGGSGAAYSYDVNTSTGEYNHHNYCIGASGGGITGNLSECDTNLGSTELWAATQNEGGYAKYISNGFSSNGSFGSGSNGYAGGGSGYYGGAGTYKGAGSGSSYIGNSSLQNKAMYCYQCEESSVTPTKTISTPNVSESPISNYAKKGNGYAKITFIE